MSEIREQETSVDNVGALRTGTDSMPRWFAVYTTPRHEKHVSELLAERRIEAFVPLYRTTHQWQKSRPIVLELPLFPTYVFVRIARQARGAVLGTPLEIDALRFGILERTIDPHPYLTVGERVRIKAGVMAGVQGVLVRKKNEFRVVLSLDTIMLSVAVEVSVDDVEPVNFPSAEIA